MKKFIRVTLPLVCISLSACTPKNTSQTSDTSSSTTIIDDTGISFEKAYYEIANAQINEISEVSEQTVTETTVGGVIKEEKTLNYKIYEDGTSSQAGTYTQYINDEVSLSDTIKGVRTTEVDTYDFEGTQESYEMYVDIVDYVDNASFKSAYSDSMTKKFIFNSKQEAQASGIDSDLYIIKNELEFYTTANISQKVASFIDEYIASNYYISQLGLETINVEENENTWDYSFVATYSYPGEGSTITETISLGYSFDKEKTHLLDYSYIYESVEADNTSSYTSSIASEGNNKYEERLDTKGSEVIKPYSYSLQTINQLGFKARNAKFDDVVVDKDAIPATCSYIFPYAESYTPSKALDISITNVSSSNESVVKLDENGRFVIVGAGKTTVVVSYYKKVANIYRLATISTEITVTEAQAESISFTPKSNMYLNYGLNTSQTYVWSASVYPNKVPQNVAASSSDSTIVEVQNNGDNTFTLIPKKPGKVTITVASEVTPEVTATKEFYVLDDSTDYRQYLLTNTFTHDSPYGYTTTMTFSEDGTGTTVQTIKDGSSGPNVSTFKWTLTNTEVTFSNWSGKYLDNNFVTGTIAKFLDRTGEPMGIYAETDAKGQVYVI